MIIWDIIVSSSEIFYLILCYTADSLLHVLDTSLDSKHFDGKERDWFILYSQDLIQWLIYIFKWINEWVND